MSKKQHEREMARARAKRLAEQRQVRRKRQGIGIGITVLVAAVAVVVGLQLAGGDDPEVAIDTSDAVSEDPELFSSEQATPSEPTGDDTVDPAAAGPCPEPPADAPTPAGTQYDAPPEMQLDPETSYRATLETSCGTVVMDLYAQDAPLAVNNFVFLAREGFYDGVVFHRVIDGFMIQGGDPTGTGTGGPGYQFADELDTVEQYGFGRGQVAMANSGPDTNGSQFFIVEGDASHLTTHTVFGEVVEGMDVVDQTAVSPAGSVVILSAEITESPAT